VRRKTLVRMHLAAGAAAVAGAMLAPAAAADADSVAPPITDASQEPADLPDLSSPSGPPAGPAATLSDILAQAHNNALDPAVLLGQRPVESGPDAAPPAPLSLTPLSNAYLLPQNLVPSAPGQGTVAGIEPGQENATTTFRGYLSRLRDQHHDGGLAGALLGQRPQSDLGGPPPAAITGQLPPHQPPAPPVIPPIPPSSR
jgi:hypothetical protein